MKRFLTVRHGFVFMSGLGIAVLSFLGGAAVMYFGLPSSQYLRGAFKGADQLFKPGPLSNPALSYDLTKAGVSVDQAAATSDGFTLVSTTTGTRAMLIDMRGNVVQKWQMPERCPWEASPDAPAPGPDDPIAWQRCHLYPNGDLLALCCKGVGSPYGYGLVKLDKDSKVLWGFAGKVHHDFDVGEDGRIYVLTQKTLAERPQGLDWVPLPCAVDHVVVLSPEGKPEADVDILATFAKSEYLLSVMPSFGIPGLGPPGPGQQQQGGKPAIPGPPPGFGQRPIPGQPPPGQPPSPERPPMPPPPVEDVLHTNGVVVLSRAMAPKFPSFKAGQVLLSMRTPSTLAVLDLQTRSVVWAAKGVWQYQHDAQFLNNGRLLLFDNFGSPSGSRVIEYDPVTDATPWWYGGEKESSFLSAFRGTTQRLPNGNTLITISDQHRVIEVTKDRKIVWEWSIPAPATPSESLAITGAWRYAASDLTFLKSAPRPRVD